MGLCIVFSETGPKSIELLECNTIYATAAFI